MYKKINKEQWKDEEENSGRMNKRIMEVGTKRKVEV